MKLLRRRIELYMKRTGTTPSRFGLDAVNDSRFVFEVRNGRKVSADVCARVHAWLDRQYRQRSR